MMENRSDLRILFVARNYPPVIGGLERNAEDFYSHMKEIADVDLLANTAGKKNLIWFFIRTCLNMILVSNRYDIIHFNDAVMSPLLILIRAFSRAKATFTVNGLDIVYKNIIFQMAIPFFLRHADKLFPISQYTKIECETRGINPNKLKIITVGINISEMGVHNGHNIKNFLEKYLLDNTGKKILVSIGRLVERKGHAWFIQSVMPLLPDDFYYIIGGDGPERQKLLKIINESGLNDRVQSIGRVTEGEKQIMYQIAHLFIMPNISMKNDPEGFGIVLLEAGSYNVPVIATNIEGISSAVLEGITGRLIPERDVERFVSAIKNPDIERTKIKAAIEEHFSWEIIAQRYLEEFELIANRHKA